MRAGLLAVAGVVASAGACAVTAPAAPRCVVIGGAALPAAVGGSTGVCAAIEAAVARAAPGADWRVEVRLPRPYILSAAVVLGDGRRLPEQRLTVSDAPLSQAMVERFAERIAAAVRG
ncbi:hypothetical protein OMW55_03825 [Sphingomonas sp. BN140010]|uniref:Lipoprotein n=1 Tax=Sphingomonas arvum TaxID=2992113 RepID=A0ABT3JCY3_9SPHN|nr:hypothetical protein [Sphingomonas sp. BN140010]MCW3796933.1 hypothetical protein [Sphingomonas sp. BN140010]